jgi:hypothetical protein
MPTGGPCACGGVGCLREVVARRPRRSAEPDSDVFTVLTASEPICGISTGSTMAEQKQDAPGGVLCPSSQPATLSAARLGSARTGEAGALLLAKLVALASAAGWPCLCVRADLRWIASTQPVLSESASVAEADETACAS